MKKENPKLQELVHELLHRKEGLGKNSLQTKKGKAMENC
jgi:hypothetical protein